MEKVLVIRNLGRRFPLVSSSLFSLLYGGHGYIAQVNDYQSVTHLGQKYVSHQMVGRSYNGTFESMFSSMASTILIQARDPSRLSLQLENAIDEHRLDDAWKLYEQYVHMEGFPRKSLLNKLIVGFAGIQELQWLEKAYGFVEVVFNKNKFELLEKETLIYLSFILARFELPVPASTILRKLVEKEEFVPVSAWSGILAHMSSNATGAFLAAELINEIGYLFKDNRVDPRKKSNRPLLSMKPNTNAFNITLAGCLLFGTTRKAEELLELMPRVGVKPNSILLIIMAQIYERNGRREEIKKLKRFIDEATDLGDLQFQQFYNCLLSCHLKFGDLGSASEMVLEMLRKAKEARNALIAATPVSFDKSSSHLQSPTHVPEIGKFCGLEKHRLSEGLAPSYLEFLNDRNFSRFEAEATELLDGLLTKLQARVEFVTSGCGILHPTDKIYAKLVKAFLEANKVRGLAEFLIKADKEDYPRPTEKSAVVHVINACVSLGWLDQAYDLLDEMRFAGVKTGSSVYSVLLEAYCKENKPKEVHSLLRDARKAGVQLDSRCYEALIKSRVIDKDTYGALNLFKEMKETKISKGGHPEFSRLVKEHAESGEAGLMSALVEEIKEGQTKDCGVHDWNNVIHFFCKKRLMQDAQKALKRMKALGHQPNAQTYHSLITAYAALGGKYIEITELWGEMKVLASVSSIKFDQELLDSLLYSFVRGGFFLRANEVVEMMEKEALFIDKYKYRSLFLKYHKTLYKGKTPKFQTEAHLKRREAALSFKKWVGLGWK